MKKYNKNVIVFIFFVVFVISGMLSIKYQKLLIKQVLTFATDIIQGRDDSFSEFTKQVDSITQKLSYHDQMMDVNSIKDNILGTKEIIKNNTVIVKTDNDYLLFPDSNKISENSIGEVVKRIETLKTVSENYGADFLYCAVPNKEYYFTTPGYAKDYSKKNFDLFIESLKKTNISYLDFSKKLNNNGDDNTFYRTDHHWTVRSGFFATQSICDELNSRFGFDYVNSFTDISNYHSETYQNYFLGSQGKKVGTYFTWHGADDFELILPKFETDLTESQPIKNETRNGDFEETVFFKDYLRKDYYNVSNYYCYSGGDLRLQIMKNNLNMEGKKILLIRDSFACVVAPFLALQTSELHILDMRDYEYYIGEKLNVEDYIEEIQPDYVIVLYSGVSGIEGAHGKYDFF